MIISVLGPPNCGKSIFAERLCVFISKKLRSRPYYFATLPSTNENYIRIYRHEIRRGARWRLKKMDLPADLIFLEMVKVSRRGGCVLLDGIAQLIVKQANSYNFSDDELMSFADEFIKVLKRTSINCVWLIVDSVPRYDDESVLSLILCKLYGELSEIGLVVSFKKNLSR